MPGHSFVFADAKLTSFHWTSPDRRGLGCGSDFRCGHRKIAKGGIWRGLRVSKFRLFAHNRELIQEGD